MRDKIGDWAVEHIPPWYCKYRIREITSYKNSAMGMITKYIIEARAKFTPFWFEVEYYFTFKYAYRKMQELRNIPKPKSHVYTEDECILELIDED